MASGAGAHVGGQHGFPKKFSGAWLWFTYRGHLILENLVSLFNSMFLLMIYVCFMRVVWGTLFDEVSVCFVVGTLMFFETAWHERLGR